MEVDAVNTSALLKRILKIVYLDWMQRSGRNRKEKSEGKWMTQTDL